MVTDSKFGTDQEIEMLRSAVRSNSPTKSGRLGQFFDQVDINRLIATRRAAKAMYYNETHVVLQLP